LDFPQFKESVERIKIHGLFFDILIPLLLMFVPALLSFVLNLILWVWKLYPWCSQKYYRLNVKRSICSTRGLSSNSSIRRCLTIESNSSLSSVTLSQSKQTRTKNSYHFIMIMLNIIDLPYYGFMMFNLYQNYYGLCNSYTQYTEAITRIFYILGHSINIFIYLLFHKNFRYATREVI